jgi:hypothetical protein
MSSIFVQSVSLLPGVGHFFVELILPFIISSIFMHGNCLFRQWRKRRAETAGMPMWALFFFARVEKARSEDGDFLSPPFFSQGMAEMKKMALKIFTKKRKFYGTE